MKIPIAMHRPFGPYVLETTCPQSIVDSINTFTEESCKNEEMKEFYCYSSGNLPNLLLRDFEVVYLTEDFCSEIGLKKFVEKLGNYYLDNLDTISHGFSTVNLSIINKNIDPDQTFKYSDRITYADAWVNRYYAGDYTPLHDHGADIAGIIILEYPEDELNEENLKNRESEMDALPGSRSGGKVQFVHGMNGKFCADEYTPEQYKYKTFLFPAWLSHLVYPMKTNSERRTLSFNLISEKAYLERKTEWI